MRRLGVSSTILAALLAAAVAPPALAQQTLPGAAPVAPAPTMGATTAPLTPPSGGNVSATGRKMPPTTGRMPAAKATGIKATDSKPTDAKSTDSKATTAAKSTDSKATDLKAASAKAADTKAADTKASEAKMKAATEAEMLKAQKAAEARNKAWDAKMRKTMGSICTGC